MHNAKIQEFFPRENSVGERCSNTAPNIIENYLLVLPIGIDVRAELEWTTTSLKVNTHVQRDVLRTSTTRSTAIITPKSEPKESLRSLQSHPMPLFVVGSSSTLLEKHYEQLGKLARPSDRII
jgi:hypothetical protein